MRRFPTLQPAPRYFGLLPKSDTAASDLGRAWRRFENLEQHPAPDRESDPDHGLAGGESAVSSPSDNRPGKRSGRGRAISMGAAVGEESGSSFGRPPDRKSVAAERAGVYDQP